jgi:hypothetical protein
MLWIPFTGRRRQYRQKNRVVDSSFAPENIETMMCGYIYPVLVEHHTSFWLSTTPYCKYYNEGKTNILLPRISETEQCVKQRKPNQHGT